jgi:hypothetical protein
MTGLRTSTWIWASAGTVALMGAMVACSLNPQPLPPDTYNDAGVSGAAADGSFLALEGGGGLARPDAGTSMPATGGGDAGESRDAATADGGSIDGGSSDAAIDVEDGGVPADSTIDAAADGTTDAAADGATDAAIDVDDAPGEAD